MIEHKIGEIITLDDGREVKVVEVDNSSCRGCVFGGTDCNDANYALGVCFWKDRTDRTNIIYKEIKKKNECHN